jgi:hypothetical protein
VGKVERKQRWILRYFHYSWNDGTVRRIGRRFLSITGIQTPPLSCSTSYLLLAKSRLPVISKNKVGYQARNGKIPYQTTSYTAYTDRISFSRKKSGNSGKSEIEIGGAKISFSRSLFTQEFRYLHKCSWPYVYFISSEAPRCSLAKVGLNRCAVLLPLLVPRVALLHVGHGLLASLQVQGYTPDSFALVACAQELFGSLFLFSFLFSTSISQQLKDKFKDW